MFYNWKNPRRVLDWGNVNNRVELLAMRARQLEMQSKDMEEVVLRKKRLRFEGKGHFDEDNNAVEKLLKEGDLVLHHDPLSKIDKSRSRKLAYRWYGPYQIREAFPEKGTYILEELDGTPLAATYAGVRLKKFITRGGTIVPVLPDANPPTVDDEDEITPQPQLRRSDRIGQMFASSEQMEPSSVTAGVGLPTRRSDLAVQIPPIDPARQKEFVSFEDDD